MQILIITESKESAQMFIMIPVQWWNMDTIQTRPVYI